MGTVMAGEAAEAGAVATARRGRRRGTRGGVIVRGGDGRGVPPGGPRGPGGGAFGNKNCKIWRHFTHTNYKTASFALVL